MDKVKEIKVLNIAQPNAHNVIYNGKNVENRSSISYFRGTIAIYASATLNKDRFEDSGVAIEDCEFGKIIGFVDMVDCIVEEELTDKTRKWFHGPYGYILENISPLKNPIEVRPPKGAITWWTLEGDAVSQCLKQIDLESYIPVEKVKADPKKPKQKQSKERGKLIPSIELSSVIGFEPISLRNAWDDLYDYIIYFELDHFKDDIKDREHFFVKTDKNLKNIVNENEVHIDELYMIVERNLDFPDKNKLRPSNELAQIIGKSPVTLKKALTLAMDYIDKKDLYGSFSSDSFDFIKGDEKLNNLIPGEEISISEFNSVLRKHLSS